MEWGIKIKTEKLLLLANMESQGPITTLSPNPRTPRPDPGGNSFQHSEAQWSQEMGPDRPSSLPRVFRWWCREGTQEGPSGHLSGGVGADSPMSSQVKKAERRALPGAQASPEGPAQGWGPISPRMNAAPEPSHKAKKKKTPRRSRWFSSVLCVPGSRVSAEFKTVQHQQGKS